jgi:hypothetical protein
MQRELLGLRCPAARCWVAPAESPLLATAPAQANAWTCCLQPGREHEVVLVGGWLDRARAGAHPAAEVLRVLAHERTHLAVWAASQPGMSCPPWHPLIANVFEGVAALTDAYCFLTLREARRPSTERAEEWMRQRWALHSGTLGYRLEHHGDWAPRVQAAARLAVELLTARDDGSRAAALDRALGGQRTWVGWQAWLKILAWPSETAAPITDLKASYPMGTGPDPARRPAMNAIDLNPDHPAVIEEVDAAIAAGANTPEKLMEQFGIKREAALAHLERYQPAS